MKLRMLLGMVILALFLAACATEEPQLPNTGTDATLVPGTLPDVPAEAVLEAQKWLSDYLSTTLEQVEIVEAKPMEWTDSCLGLGQPNESCAQVITPGWQVMLKFNDQIYEVRTDETGSNIRLSTSAESGLNFQLESSQWILSAGDVPGVAVNYLGSTPSEYFRRAKLLAFESNNR